MSSGNNAFDRRSKEKASWSRTNKRYKRKNWIDFNAMGSATNELWDLVLKTANGQNTKNEIGGYREIAIFKDGVTL